jgi:hypothetical protein
VFFSYKLRESRIEHRVSFFKAASYKLQAASFLASSYKLQAASFFEPLAYSGVSFFEKI